ncbi:uncharacterized protein [Dermacentor albipictus]|uniref:uncharacterized protein n=1 Tax=Dermacentor albipictus TaxID=60249 RepID=UPI0031FC4EE6
MYSTSKVRSVNALRPECTLRRGHSACDVLIWESAMKTECTLRLRAKEARTRNSASCSSRFHLVCKLRKNEGCYINVLKHFKRCRTTIELSRFSTSGFKPVNTRVPGHGHDSQERNRDHMLTMFIPVLTKRDATDDLVTDNFSLWFPNLQLHALRFKSYMKLSNCSPTLACKFGRRIGTTAHCALLSSI